MKIKLDENLPHQLVTLLSDLGHEVHGVSEEGLNGHPDNEIWAAVQRESRFLITQDMDFSDLRVFAPGTHHGLLLVRLSSPNRRDLVGRIVELFQFEDTNQWSGCFVVATERKIRVIKKKKAYRAGPAKALLLIAPTNPTLSHRAPAAPHGLPAEYGAA